MTDYTTLHNVMQHYTTLYKAIRYYKMLIIQEYTTLHKTIQHYAIIHKAMQHYNAFQTIFNNSKLLHPHKISLILQNLTNFSAQFNQIH